MKPPTNTELFETPISTHWVEENGILCGLSKKTERRIEHYQEIMGFYKRLTKDGNKFCLIADSTNSMPLTREIIEYISTEHPKYLKAIAILSTVPLEPTQVSTFLKYNFSNFPVMKFSNEKDAREWLKQYL